MVKMVELIYCDQRAIGNGTDGDPKRRLEQWFEKDGTLVFEKDSWLNERKEDEKNNT